MLEPWHQDTQQNFSVPVQGLSFSKSSPKNVQGPSSDQVNHRRTPAGGLQTTYLCVWYRLYQSKGDIRNGDTVHLQIL